MKLDPSSLSGDREEIVSVFIDHIARTAEEQEAEEEEGRRKTDVKVFLANNDGFEVGNLSSAIQNSALPKDA